MVTIALTCFRSSRKFHSFIFSLIVNIEFIEGLWHEKHRGNVGNTHGLCSQQLTHRPRNTGISVQMNLSFILLRHTEWWTSLKRSRHSDAYRHTQQSKCVPCIRKFTIQWSPSSALFFDEQRDHKGDLSGTQAPERALCVNLEYGTWSQQVQGRAQVL